MNKYFASVLATMLLFNSTQPKVDPAETYFVETVDAIDVLKYYFADEYKKINDRVSQEIINTGCAGLAVFGSVWSFSSWAKNKLSKKETTQKEAEKEKCIVTQYATKKPTLTSSWSLDRDLFSTEFNHGGKLASACLLYLAVNKLVNYVNKQQKKYVSQQVLGSFLKNWKNIKPLLEKEMPEQFITRLEKLSNSYKRNAAVIENDAADIVAHIQYIIRHTPNAINDACKADFLNKFPEVDKLYDSIKKAIKE